MRDQRWRRVGTGPHGQRRRRAYVATFRNYAKGSALEPQRLSRRRFPLSTPFGMALGVKTDPGRVVRHLLPLLANIEGQPAIATAIHGIGRQARANPGVDPLTLITGGGELRCGRLRLDDGRMRLARLDGLSRLVLDHRRPLGKITFDNIVGIVPVIVVNIIARLAAIAWRRQNPPIAHELARPPARARARPACSRLRDNAWAPRRRPHSHQPTPTNW